MRILSIKSIAVLVALSLLLSVMPLKAQAAEEYVVPGSATVYHLDADSTNNKTQAEYLAVDGQTVYVIFDVGKKKPLRSGTITLNETGQMVDLVFETELYSSLSIDGNIIKPKVLSNDTYYWQIATCDLSQLANGEHVTIDADAGAGGFNINNLTYTMSYTYGLEVTKELVSINGVPAEGTPVVDIGDTILWHIIVTNVGNIDLHDITVDDKLPGTVLDDTAPFELKGGEQKIIAATYVVQPSDAGKTIVNVVAAQSSGGLVESGTSSESIIKYVVEYDANGGQGAPELQTKEENQSIFLSSQLPIWEGHEFLGWNTEADGSGTAYAPGVAFTDNTNLKLYAQWSYAVIFHANHPSYTGSSDIFRTYYSYNNTQQSLRLQADGTVETFYEIPTFSYTEHNGYIFKGWYLDKDNENDSRPIRWDTVYTTSVDVYAHWIEVGTVAKEQDYKILEDGASSYSGFDLIGVQIRTLKDDPGGYYGTPDSGLRFLCVLSESVYEQINALHTNNASGADYGFVTAKTSTAQKYAAAAGNPTDYYLQYKGSNVNGIDTSAAFKYVKNSLCSGAGITDHYDGEAYRIYTVVITYTNKTGDALAEAQAVEFLARAYIKYYDANGLERVHYHNYTGSSVYGGCSASYTWVESALGSGGEVG